LDGNRSAPPDGPRRGLGAKGEATSDEIASLRIAKNVLAVLRKAGFQAELGALPRCDGPSLAPKAS